MTNIDTNKYIRILKWLYGSLDENFDENRRNLIMLANKQANVNITHTQGKNKIVVSFDFLLRVPSKTKHQYSPFSAFHPNSKHYVLSGRTQHRTLLYNNGKLFI